MPLPSDNDYTPGTKLADLYPGLTFHQIFETIAEKYPDKVALVEFDEEGNNPRSYTYKEINNRANQLAAYLFDQKLTPENKNGFSPCVGIHLKQSHLRIISILAALKARIAYIPLDPAQTSSQLKDFVAQAEPQIILSEHDLLSTKIINDNKTQIINLNNFKFDPNKSIDNLNLEINSLLLAYIIFSSGSTGKPKGMAIPHEGLRYRILAHIDMLNISTKDNCAQWSPFSTDAWLMEVTMTLCAGACLYLVPTSIRSDANRLGDFYQNNEVSIGIIVPSMLSVLDPENFSKWREIICNGEPLNQALVKLWLEKKCENGMRKFINGYGPSEVTVGATLSKCNPDEEVHLGKPMLGLKLYLLNSHLEEVSDNEQGKIHIDGPGLALGYIKNSSMTAIKFIPHQDGNRIYDTGDLASYKNKNLRYDGREDSQLKIYGQMVRREEIEVVLRDHSAVANACVSHIEYFQSNTKLYHLVAHIEPKKEIPCDKEILYEYLLTRLPRYKVPARWIFHKKLPLNANGKIDRNQLDNSKFEMTGSGERINRDFYDHERDVLEIWCDILGTNSNNSFVHEDFFHAGGDSIKANLLINELKNEFPSEDFPSLELNIKKFIANPTISALAREIRKSRSNFDPLRCLKTEGNKPPLIMIHSISGDPDLDYGKVASTLNRSIYGLKARGLRDLQDAGETIEELSDDYLKSIIKLVSKNNSFTIGGWSSGAVLVFDLAEKLTKQGYKVYSFLFDGVAPHYLQNLSLEKHADFCVELSNHLARLYSSDFKCQPNEIIKVKSKKQQLEMIFSGLAKHLTGAPRVKRANEKNLKVAHLIKLAELKYRVEAPLTNILGNKTILFASDKTLSQTNPTLGWEKHIDEVIVIKNSNHFDVLEKIFQHSSFIKLLDEAHASIHTQTWNLPEVNPNFVARKELLTQIIQSVMSSDHTNNVVTLYGPRGSGKTELAKHWINTTNFAIRCWFSAANILALKLQYLEFGNALKILPQNTSLDRATKQVINWFGENSNCLIVYDDAMHMSNLQFFLPRNSRNKILLTSVFSDFSNTNNICVDKMNLDEASDLTQKIGIMLSIETNKLTNAMGHFPLALTLASTYIKNTNCSTKKYLTLFHKHAKNKTQTNVEIACQIILLKISELYPDAKELLTYFSYLYHNSILESTLLHLFDHHGKTKNLYRSIEILERFSLIFADKTKSKTFYISPLLQEIFRFQINTDASNLIIVQQIIEIFTKKHILKTSPTETTSTLILNTETLLDHANELGFNFRNNHSNRTAIISLLKFLANTYNTLDLSEKRYCYEQIIDIETKYLQNSSANRNSDHKNIKEAILQLNRVENILEWLQKLIEWLPIFSNPYFHENKEEEARFYLRLAQAYKNLGVYHQELSFLKKAEYIFQTRNSTKEEHRLRIAEIKTKLASNNHYKKEEKIIYLKEAFKIFSIIDNKHVELVNVLIEHAKIIAQNIDEQEDYLSRATYILEQNNCSDIATIKINLANAYTNINNFEYAKNLRQETLIATQIEELNEIANELINNVACFHRQKNEVIASQLLEVLLDIDSDFILSNETCSRLKKIKEPITIIKPVHGPCDPASINHQLLNALDKFYKQSALQETITTINNLENKFNNGFIEKMLAMRFASCAPNSEEYNSILEDIEKHIEKLIANQHWQLALQTLLYTIPYARKGQSEIYLSFLKQLCNIKNVEPPIDWQQRKRRLKDIRDLFISKTTTINVNHIHSYKKFETAQKKYSENILLFISNIFKECEQILGPPPYEYCVLALGSFSTANPTLFSDFEYALITDAPHLTDLAERKLYDQYFGLLIQLFHFKINLLGEFGKNDIPLGLHIDPNVSPHVFNDQILGFYGTSYSVISNHTETADLGRGYSSLYPLLSPTVIYHSAPSYNYQFDLYNNFHEVLAAQLHEKRDNDLALYQRFALRQFDIHKEELRNQFIYTQTHNIIKIKEYYSHGLLFLISDLAIFHDISLTDIYHQTYSCSEIINILKTKMIIHESLAQILAWAVKAVAIIRLQAQQHYQTQPKPEIVSKEFVTKEKLKSLNLLKKFPEKDCYVLSKDECAALELISQFVLEPYNKVTTSDLHNLDLTAILITKLRAEGNINKLKNHLKTLNSLPDALAPLKNYRNDMTFAIISCFLEKQVLNGRKQDWKLFVETHKKELQNQLIDTETYNIEQIENLFFNGLAFLLSDLIIAQNVEYAPDGILEIIQILKEKNILSESFFNVLIWAIKSISAIYQECLQKNSTPSDNDLSTLTLIRDFIFTPYVNLIKIKRFQFSKFDPITTFIVQINDSDKIERLKIELGDPDHPLNAYQHKLKTPISRSFTEKFYDNESYNHDNDKSSFNDELLLIETKKIEVTPPVKFIPPAIEKNEFALAKPTTKFISPVIKKNEFTLVKPRFQKHLNTKNLIDSIFSKKPPVIKFFLQKKRLGDSGLIYLAEKIDNNYPLQEIYLSDNNITFEGAYSLYKVIKHNTHILYIDWGNNNEVDDALKNKIENILDKNLFDYGKKLAAKYIGLYGEIDWSNLKMTHLEILALAALIQTNFDISSIKLNSIFTHQSCVSVLLQAAKLNSHITKIEVGEYLWFNHDEKEADDHTELYQPINDDELYQPTNIVNCDRKTRVQIKKMIDRILSQPLEILRFTVINNFSIVYLTNKLRGNKNIKTLFLYFSENVLYKLNTFEISLTNLLIKNNAITSIKIFWSFLDNYLKEEITPLLKYNRNLHATQPISYTDVTTDTDTNSDTSIDMDASTDVSLVFRRTARRLVDINAVHSSTTESILRKERASFYRKNSLAKAEPLSADTDTNLRAARRLTENLRAIQLMGFTDVSGFDIDTDRNTDSIDINIDTDTENSVSKKELAYFYRNNFLTKTEPLNTDTVVPDAREHHLIDFTLFSYLKEVMIANSLAKDFVSSFSQRNLTIEDEINEILLRLHIEKSEEESALLMQLLNPSYKTTEEKVPTNKFFNIDWLLIKLRNLKNIMNPSDCISKFPRAKEINDFLMKKLLKYGYDNDTNIFKLVKKTRKLSESLTSANNLLFGESIIYANTLYILEGYSLLTDPYPRFTSGKTISFADTIIRHVNGSHFISKRITSSEDEIIHLNLEKKFQLEEEKTAKEKQRHHEVNAKLPISLLTQSWIFKHQGKKPEQQIYQQPMHYKHSQR